MRLHLKGPAGLAGIGLALAVALLAAPASLEPAPGDGGPELPPLPIGAHESKPGLVARDGRCPAAVHGDGWSIHRVNPNCNAVAYLLEPAAAMAVPLGSDFPNEKLFRSIVFQLMSKKGGKVRIDLAEAREEAADLERILFEQQEQEDGLALGILRRLAGYLPLPAVAPRWSTRSELAYYRREIARVDEERARRRLAALPAETRTEPGRSAPNEKRKLSGRRVVSAGFFDDVVDFVEDVGGAISDTANSIGEAAGGAINAIVSTAQEVVNAIVDFANTALTVVVQVVNTLTRYTCWCSSGDKTFSSSVSFPFEFDFRKAKNPNLRKIPATVDATPGIDASFTIAGSANVCILLALSHVATLSATANLSPRLNAGLELETKVPPFARDWNFERTLASGWFMVGPIPVEAGMDGYLSAAIAGQLEPTVNQSGTNLIADSIRLRYDLRTNPGYEAGFSCTVKWGLGCSGSYQLASWQQTFTINEMPAQQFITNSNRIGFELAAELQVQAQLGVHLYFGLVEVKLGPRINVPTANFVGLRNLNGTFTPGLATSGDLKLTLEADVGSKLLNLLNCKPRLSLAADAVRFRRWRLQAPPLSNDCDLSLDANIKICLYSKTWHLWDYHTFSGVTMNRADYDMELGSSYAGTFACGAEYGGLKVGGADVTPATATSHKNFVNGACSGSRCDPNLFN